MVVNGSVEALTASFALLVQESKIFSSSSLLANAF